MLVDEGDLALLRNPMDLAGAAIRFTPSGGGYSAARLSLPLEPDTGTPLSLGDDASSRIALSFAFPFYGQTHSAAFVNSDGNVTFGQKDDASTARTVGRLVNGPPRAAPLLADLDPSAGGTVSVQDLRDHVTVTWRDVPQFEKADKNTFQVTLWADGRVDFVYDAALSTGIEEGATGVAPGGGQGGVTAVDFANAGAVTGAGALAESFRDRDGLDTVAVARKFYATHGDDYQQLVVYTSRRLVPAGTFAFEQTVHNTDAGIGDGQADLSREYGSAGRLESFITMDMIGKYPDDLSQRFLGEDSTLSVLAHEVGHRWLANARFRDGATISTELLGRDEVHWSFFADTDGSFLEGNDIAAAGRRPLPHRRGGAPLQRARPVPDGPARRERGAAVVLRAEPVRHRHRPRPRSGDRRRCSRGTRQDVDDRRHGGRDGRPQPERHALGPALPPGLRVRDGGRARRSRPPSPRWSASAPPGPPSSPRRWKAAAASTPR